MNNVLKDRNGNIMDPKIPRYEILKYDLETDGEPVKMGTSTDGKADYIKRISTGPLPNNDALQVSTGLNVNDVNIKSISALAYRSTDRTYIPLPFISMAGSNIGLNTIVVNNILHILIETTIDRTNFVGYVEIKYELKN